MFGEIKAYYKRLLPQLTDDAWADMQQHFVIKQYQKGQAIVKEGEICNDVCYINSGFVRYYQWVDGKDVSTGFMHAGEYISAYESFLTRQPSLETLEALEDTQMICLSYNVVQDMYRNYPIFQEFGRKMAEKLFIWACQRKNALLLLTPEQRYERLIEHGSPLLQKVPQYMLASYIGITPEHLSRIRKKLLTRPAREVA